MNADAVLQIAREALFLCLIISAPPVIVAMVVGLIISLFQAATQLQEQTLTVVPKIIAVFLILAATGLWMVRLLIRFSVVLFDHIARIGPS